MNARQKSWLLPPCALTLAAGILAGRASGSMLWPLLALAVCLAAFLLLRGWFRFASCLLAFFCLGGAAGVLAFHPVLPPEGEFEITGIVSGEVTRGGLHQLRIPLTSVTLNRKPFDAGAYWTFYAEEAPEDLLPGKAVSFHASVYHPTGAVNPDGYNFRESLLRRGISVGIYGCDALRIGEPDVFSLTGAVASLRHRLSASLISVLGEETGRYASALLLGMSSLIPSEDHEAFASLGIAHILSVSGFHVGILIGVMAALFRLMKLSQRARLILYACFLSFYVLLCGASQSVIRASLLTLLLTEGRILRRPRSGLHLLSASMILTLLVSPVQLTGASFQLSYASMLGLVWFSPWAVRLDPFRNRSLSRIFQILVLTFGVQLAVLFPQLMHYQRLPLWSFLFNLPATAVFSLLILLCWIVLMLLPVPGICAWLAKPLSSLTSAMLSAVRALGSLPGQTLWIHAPNLLTLLGVVLLLFGLCAFLRLPALRRLLPAALGLAALVLSLLPIPHPGTEYIQFSAGNADAAVLRDRDRVIVVDTGDTTGQLSGYLRHHRLSPDAVILTHLHADHAGGLDAMLRDQIPVPLLYLPDGAEEQLIHPDILALLSRFRESGTEIRFLARGDVLPLPSGTLTVLWPVREKIRPGQDANHYSLVSRLSLRGTSMLLTGDLTGTYENYAAAPADILKAAHHGSASSTGAGFLNAVAPRNILLSCRALTRTASFRSRCGSIPVWSTAESGAITIRFTEGAYTIIPTLKTGLPEVVN